MQSHPAIIEKEGNEYKRVGDYLIGHVVGQGGYGKVMVARHKVTDEKVC